MKKLLASGVIAAAIAATAASHEAERTEAAEGTAGSATTAQATHFVVRNVTRSRARAARAAGVAYRIGRTIERYTPYHVLPGVSVVLAL